MQVILEVSWSFILVVKQVESDRSPDQYISKG